MEKIYTVALAGNPNVGKSTIFNNLTGMHQHTGNWTGKTVANATGKLTIKDKEFLLVDIPGTYSIMSNSEEEEIARVTPVIEAVKKHFDIPVSIDTYKGKVTLAALQAGADLVNDIWGFKHDPEVAAYTAKYNAACCLMHNRNEAVYDDFQKDFIRDMQECIAIAKKANVPDDKIMLDPGVGFGKTYEMNLEIINHLEIMKQLNYPVLLGTSRKSVIGLTLDLPADERVEGTLATTVIGVMKGCSFVRVHDVKENYRIIKMTEAILSK